MQEILFTAEEAERYSRENRISLLYTLDEVWRAVDAEERKACRPYDAEWVRLSALSAAYTAGYVQAKRETRRAKKAGRRQ